MPSIIDLDNGDDYGMYSQYFQTSYTYSTVLFNSTTTASFLTASCPLPTPYPKPVYVFRDNPDIYTDNFGEYLAYFRQFCFDIIQVHTSYVKNNNQSKTPETFPEGVFIGVVVPVPYETWLNLENPELKPYYDQALALFQSLGISHLPELFQYHQELINGPSY